MKRKIVFATSNVKKIEEVVEILDGKIEILSLADIGFDDEIDEPFDTFSENAMIKAQTVYRFARIPTLADDSGLVVKALNGAPGVKSARYAGEPVDHVANMEKLLKAMKDENAKEAYFETVLAYVDEDRNVIFRGRCHGRITSEMRGDGGFGYDPIFEPLGHGQTFGELPSVIKNSLSHRAEAIRSFVDFLQQNNL